MICLLRLVQFTCIVGVTCLSITCGFVWDVYWEFALLLECLLLRVVITSYAVLVSIFVGSFGFLLIGVIIGDHGEAKILL